MPTITVTITPQGTTHIEVTGVHGSGCLALTKDLEQALGGGDHTVEREIKPEFYESESEADYEGGDYA